MSGPPSATQRPLRRPDPSIGRPRIYLASDPYETKDLAREQPQRVAQLQALLKKYAAGDR